MAESICFENIFWQAPSALKPILNELSGEFRRGSFVALLGPNGAGKTSLLRVLNGFLRADRGRVMIGEKELKTYNRRDLALEIAYLPQQSEAKFELPVLEIIKMARYSRLGMFEDMRVEDREAVRDAITRCQCEDLLDKNFSYLSGGEKQRVLCARAIAQESSFIFLDEPVSNLDLKYQHSILHTLKQLCEEKQVGLISVMHDINLASQYCDEIYLMKDGQCVRAGKREEVLHAELLSKVYEWPLEKISPAADHGRAGESYFRAIPLLTEIRD